MRAIKRHPHYNTRPWRGHGKSERSRRLSVTEHPNSCRLCGRRPDGDYIVKIGCCVNGLRVPIVVCDANLFRATWQELLAQIGLFPEPPHLIVASRIADDYLWAEALNLGAYDVLGKPFDLTELTRSLSLAWLRTQREHRIAEGQAIAAVA